MKTFKRFGSPLLLIMYLILVWPFQGCEPDDDENVCDTCLVVFKPNIYIYPVEEIQLNVNISFPSGGEIIASVPEYADGWTIRVDTNGLINNNYDYLFYESTQPDVWQRQYGWTIKADNLEPFFRKNMGDYGFSCKEIDDFIDYWIRRFNDYAFYSICPQTKSIIDKVILLEFSKQPDSMLRLFYLIKGHNQIQDGLIEPSIYGFTREGYFVTEWGVILN